MPKLLDFGLEFRVLYSQFLLRIIDLEALSMQADVVGFLGQFAGVFIMLSLIHAGAILFYIADRGRLSFGWHFEQYLIKTLMVVTVLFLILTLDSPFPADRGGR